MLRSDERDKRLRIYIASAKPDYEFTTELVSGLDFAGYFVPTDRHDLIQGENWSSLLGKHLIEADLVVFVLSPASIGSATCQWEAEEAQRLSRPKGPGAGIQCPPASEVRGSYLSPRCCCRLKDPAAVLALGLTAKGCGA